MKKSEIEKKMRKLHDFDNGDLEPWEKPILARHVETYRAALADVREWAEAQRLAEECQGWRDRTPVYEKLIEFCTVDEEK